MAALRRSIPLIIALCLLLSLCACGSPVTESSGSASHTLPGIQTAIYVFPTESASVSATEKTTAVPSATTQTSTALPTTSAPAESDASEESREDTLPTEDETEGLSHREIAAYYLAQMDKRSQLFQLMIVAPEAICWDNPVIVPDNEELRSKPVAGLLYHAKNMENPEQLKALVEGHQQAAPLPLFICVDEEGGRVSRIMQTMGTTPIKNMFTYRGDGPERARKNARTLADDIRSFGFNLDFAPVADVWSNPENKVIGERAYSDDFNKAALLVASAVEGFHAGQVICTLKHFPGHGDTLEDSHENLAVVQKSLKELRLEEFIPFAAGIQAGADMVMTGHLLVPDIDKENPATFSHRILTEILREELGFEGVIITDALEMGAATAISTGGEACLKALLAGCDLLLAPAGQPEHLNACVDYLLEAIEEGKLSWERVEESLLRILELKVKYGILDREIPQTPTESWTEAPTEAWTEVWTEAPTESWTETPAEAWTEAPATGEESSAPGN